MTTRSHSVPGNSVIILKQSSKLPTLQSRELALLLILAAVALALAALLTQSGPALAGPLAQDSPLSPLASVSPVAEPSATPAPPTATSVPATGAPPTPPAPANPPEAAAGPPIPVAMLAAIMGVIGLAALGIALRRKS